ncbi:MAG: class I SAM-dependent methyltransferase [Ktedonobacterales bacterium]
MRFFPFRRRRQRPTLVVDPDEARYTRLGGRRHLAALPYPLPKDLEEVNRLDFQHYLLRTGFQGNYAAPITQPAAILDVGTGSARWAMEMAMLFPEAQVIGLDLVPPAVDEQQVLGRGLDQRPPNYSFQVGNVLEGLPFHGGSFDFVHMRSLASALPTAQWPHVVNELVRVTRRGGWVELAEFGVPHAGVPGLTALWQSWVELSATRGVDLTRGSTIADMLHAAGLVNIQRREIAFPMGTWGGRLGVATATDFLAIGRAMRGGMLATGVRDATTYDEVLALAQQELGAARGPQSYQPYYLAYGQKR